MALAHLQNGGPRSTIFATFEGRTFAVESIDERVEEDSEWWENEPVYKMHYQVTLEDGREVGIFRNMKTVSWYKVLE